MMMMMNQSSSNCCNRGWLLVLLMVLAMTIGTVRADGDHADGDHDHNPDEGDLRACACIADERGFTIDCSNPNFMLQSLSILEANRCMDDCSDEVCIFNYYVIQAHHDHCLHDEVPEVIETSIHNFEKLCPHCRITRKFDPNLSVCPQAFCGNQGNDAFQLMLTSNCLTDCDTQICIDQYRILRAEHDSCGLDILNESAESGIHDFELICEPYNCGVASDNSTDIDALNCTEDDTFSDSSDDTDSSSIRLLGNFWALSTTTMAVTLMVSFFVLW